MQKSAQLLLFLDTLSTGPRLLEDLLSDLQEGSNRQLRLCGIKKLELLEFSATFRKEETIIC